MRNQFLFSRSNHSFSTLMNIIMISNRVFCSTQFHASFFFWIFLVFSFWIFRSTFSFLFSFFLEFNFSFDMNEFDFNFSSTIWDEFYIRNDFELNENSFEILISIVMNYLDEHLQLKKANFSDVAIEQNIRYFKIFFMTIYFQCF